MSNGTWSCPKCNSLEHQEDTVTMTGSGFSKFLNVQNRKFLAVTCSNCNFSHEESECGNDNELFDDGLYKYKKYIENKIVCTQKEEKNLGL